MTTPQCPWTGTKLVKECVFRVVKSEAGRVVERLRSSSGESVVKGILAASFVVWLKTEGCLSTNFGSWDADAQQCSTTLQVPLSSLIGAEIIPARGRGSSRAAI